MTRPRMDLGRVAARKRGAVEKRNLAEHARLQERIEWDLHSTVALAGRLPPEWAEIWQGRTSRQTRVSLRVDDDVLRFFRTMGEGYGPRMNAVLRAFMTARLSGMIEEEDLSETYREKWMGKPRPSAAAAHAANEAMRQ
ncbi:MAG: BrnA antitoxin family protein, partial [Jannaschia sp.]